MENAEEFEKRRVNPKEQNWKMEEEDFAEVDEEEEVQRRNSSIINSSSMWIPGG